MTDPLAFEGNRFTLTVEPGDPPRIVKRGSTEALRREADALRLVADVPWAPALVSHAPGVLVTQHLPGAPRDLLTVTLDELRDLGRTLAALHALRRVDVAALPWWDAPAASADAYTRRRTGEVQACADDLGLRVTVPRPDCATPFRLVHGDLVPGNIVWTPAPALVDWEFAHFGDPAEDLAYLAELNTLDDERLATVTETCDQAVRDRVASWRPLVAMEAALWWWHAGSRHHATWLLERHGISPPSGPS